MRVIGSNLEHLAVEKLWRICFSPSWERVNAQWQKHCGALLLPFRTLGSRAFQAGPRVPHCRGFSGRGPSRAPCFGCLLTSSRGTIRISQNLKGSFSPLLKFAACHEPNRLLQWLWLRRGDGGGRGQQCGHGLWELSTLMNNLQKGWNHVYRNPEEKIKKKETQKWSIFKYKRKRLILGVLLQQNCPQSVAETCPYHLVSVIIHPALSCIMWPSAVRETNQ